MSYKGFIYKIYNDINEKLYIGQTITSIEQRWNGHLAKSRTTQPEMAISRAIKKHGEEVFHIAKIIEYTFDTKEELLECLNKNEIYYIQKYNSLTPNGYNLTPGGDNVSIKKLVAVDSYFADGKLDKKYSSIIKAANDRGYENCSTLICSCCMGEMEYCLGRVWRYHGESFNKYTVTASQEKMDRYHCEVSVDKYDTNGVFIASYNSLVEACLSLNIDRYASSPISDCCKGKRKTAYGFVWRYKDEEFNKYECISSRKIDQYDLNGVYIQTFNSIASIVKELKLKTWSNISSVCNGKKYTAYGYIWRYNGDNLDKYSLPSKKQKTGRKFRKINQYTKDGIFIKTFDTSVEAANEVGALQTSITTACRRKGSCYGYKWYYISDPNQPDKSKIIN